MADLPQQDTIVQYVADGITTTYIVPFFTPIETTGIPDLDVYTQAASAPPIPSVDINVWNVAYTYAPNLDPITGGMVVFNPGFIPPNGYIVTIVRDVSASLDVEFSNAQTFSGYTLDFALDKLLLISQQNKTYALQRNLSYIVNSYLPEALLESSVQIPVLQPGYIWIGGTNGGVLSAYLQEPSDASTLRSELANNAPVTDGANLVGYYDTVNMDSTTVSAQLTYLTEQAASVFPSGTIIDFGGTTAPTGFLACNGNSYPTATYPNLFAAIGYAWGGSGANFNVPNLSRSVTMGAGGIGSSVIGNVVGNTGGEEAHLMAANELIAHSHGIPTVQSNSSGPLGISTSNQAPNTTQASGITPAGTVLPFNIIQPAAIVLKCIKT
jgi:microcystin-dependent protein